MTFAKACEAITNYSVAHESRVGELDRLAYPDNHIEVDNRLAWFLGLLRERYPSACYVQLLRDRDAVVRSYTRRLSDNWPARRKLLDGLRRARGFYRAGLPDAFAHGILHRRTRLEPSEEELAMRLMVDTVNANIRLLRPATVTLEDPATFRAFWGRIGAEGDLERALVVFGQRHN